MNRIKHGINSVITERAPLVIVSALGAGAGLYGAISTRPTLLGMPIPADSFLNLPSADLPALHQVAVSFARGVVAVLHYGLWPVGGAAVAFCAAVLVREVWRGAGTP